MKFIETRGNDGSRPEKVSFSEAMLSPMSSFGGIYVPESLPVLGLSFLEKTDCRIRDDDCEDHRGVDHVTQECRDYCRTQKHVNQDIMELQKKAYETIAASGFREAVGTILSEPG